MVLIELVYQRYNSQKCECYVKGFLYPSQTCASNINLTGILPSKMQESQHHIFSSFFLDPDTGNCVSSKNTTFVERYPAYKRLLLDVGNGTLTAVQLPPGEEMRQQSSGDNTAV